MNQSVEEMLQRSPTGQAEEFAIHDYEGFGRYWVEEYTPLATVHAIARGIEQHGLAFAAWAEHCGRDDEAIAEFEDAYLGDWPSAVAFAEELLDDTGITEMVRKHLPDGTLRYVRFDVEALAHDLELGGDIVVIAHDSGVWIFEGNR